MTPTAAAERAGQMTKDWPRGAWSAWVHESKPGAPLVIMVAIKDGVDVHVPDELDGMAVRRITWAEATGAVSTLRKAGAA